LRCDPPLRPGLRPSQKMRSTYMIDEDVGPAIDRSSRWNVERVVRKTTASRQGHGSAPGKSTVAPVFRY